MIKINDKFKPLFDEKTRYYIITGERGASKSFTVNIWLTLKLLEQDQKALFTRYTLTSAKDSIIPEFKEKIELLNLEGRFDIQSHDITNVSNESSILFRGIKTSAGIQTAKLKSLTNVNIWILDEAEELVDEDVFDKIDLSVRKKDVKNIIILIMNPASRQHWIYKRFFENKVSEDFNGIKNNVTYINTTLEDNIGNIDKVLLSELLELKKTDPTKYRRRLLSSWINEDHNILFNESKLQRFKLSELKTDNVISRLGVIDTADEGTDFFSFPIIYKIGNKYYVVDVMHTQDNLTITKPLSLSKIIDHKLDYATVETNNQGKDYYRYLKNNIQNTTIRGVWTVQNKETRIIMQSGWILENFYFRNDYEHGSDYDIFMQHLTGYLKDVKNQKDDAADVMAASSQFIKKLFAEY